MIRRLRFLPFWILLLAAPAMIPVALGGVAVLGAFYLAAMTIGLVLLPLAVAFRILSAIASRVAERTRR